MKIKYILVIIFSILFFGCGEKKEKVPAKKVEKFVQIAEIKEREIDNFFTSNLTLEPSQKVNHSTVKGGTVEKIYKKNGEFVKKGEVVVKLSDPTTESDYISAESSLMSANSSYNIAKNNYEKFKTLFDKQLISYLEFNNYEISYINSKNSLSMAQSNFKKAKDAYDKLTRKADIDGLIGNLFVNVGDKVQANENIFTIINDQSMESYLSVPIDLFLKLKKETSVKVHVESLDKDFDANIVEINPTADNATKSYKILISIDNPNSELKDGMYAHAKILIESKKVPSIEEEAIIIKNLSNYIFKYENGKVYQIEVKKGISNSPYAEISSPSLKVGDKIVIKGTFGLQDNDSVTTINKEDNNQ